MSRAVIDILLDTLQELEQSSDCGVDDPALIKLRDEIARTIINLQLVKGLPVSPEPISAPIPLKAGEA